MATDSSIHNWKFPWTEEPGGLQSMGSQSRTQVSSCTRARAHTRTHTLICSLFFKLLILSILISSIWEDDFFFFSSTNLLLPTHLPPPSCTHAQSCNPMDFSPPDTSVHGLFQARILEWVAISFSREDDF